MKTKNILHVMALLCLLMVSKINAQSLEQKVLNALSPLDQSQVASGILYERSCEYIPLKLLDGYEVIDSINPSMFQLGLAYGMMEFANVDTLHRLNIDPFFTLVNGADDKKDSISTRLSNNYVNFSLVIGNFSTHYRKIYMFLYESYKIT
ncbi:MAG: hypothetical protein HOP11_05600 [Saprospiraceae bacterium]|nr:hypothetical protein [Saprospiraceae bacterium]